MDKKLLLDWEELLSARLAPRILVYNSSFLIKVIVKLIRKEISQGIDREQSQIGGALF